MPDLTWDEFVELNERVKQARYGEADIAEVFHDLGDVKTANGVTIVPGLRVRDYDRRETTVINVQSIDYPSGTVWFATANGGMFDGSRLEAI